MSRERNEATAQELLQRIGERRASERVAVLFSEDVSFEVQGDEQALPWIGRQRGRRAIAEWMEDLGRLTESLSFDVEDILTSADRASVVGTLQTRIKATGRVTATQFALILTISGGLISRFQMLEDSFDVSKAAR